MGDHRSSFYRRRGKRWLDLALALPLLVLLSPLLVLVALLVRLDLGSPVLFRQLRPGLDGRPFALLKFRTMHEARDESGALRPDLERITRLGRLLRRTSLDELPELINVVRGEMSLVGPRPLLMEYLPLYSPEEKRRHAVRPGLTGWAQVRARNRTTWRQRFAHDLWYVDHCSLGLDCKIIALTLGALARDDGGLAQGARLGKFEGSAAGTSPEKTGNSAPANETLSHDQTPGS